MVHTCIGIRSVRLDQQAINDYLIGTGSVGHRNSRGEGVSHVYVASLSWRRSLVVALVRWSADMNVDLQVAPLGQDSQGRNLMSRSEDLCDVLAQLG